MILPRFVHLRMHSEYSVEDGLIRLDKAIEKACDDGMGALALTDLGNLCGAIKFYQEATNVGIKPILGVDICWATANNHLDDSTRLGQKADMPRQAPKKDISKDPSRTILLASSVEGHKRLCEWLSRASLSEQQGHPEIDKAWIEEVGPAGTEGLIALSGLLVGPGQGTIARALAHQKKAEAIAEARWWQTHFPGRFYIEIQRTWAESLQEESSYLEKSIRVLAADLQIPVVATHVVQFLEAENFEAHEVRVCVATSQKLATTDRIRPYSREQYLKTQGEMEDLFKDMPEALANSVQIALRCNLILQLGKMRLPNYSTPNGLGIDEYIRELAYQGLASRLKKQYPKAEELQEKESAYQKRLDYELDVIAKMEFTGYFLIVADFINWAKRQGIPVGPGRGSGAGSLVAYVLGITDLDPLVYQLLFERFLNPGRKSMPDFDVDFCEQRRGEVIAYVRDKYGGEAVSQIATFGTMGAKAVIRDVGRVLDLGYSFCDEIARLIPRGIIDGKEITLDMVIDSDPILLKRMAQEEDVKRLMGMALQIEGITRSIGKHAGGVLIAPGKITDFSPLFRAKTATDDDDLPISQYDKDDIETVGLVKFDFLGLTTLTVIDMTEKYIQKKSPELADFSCSNLRFDDPKVYALLCHGDAVAVFQCEGEGMRQTLEQVAPSCFEDIVAIISLYRPGPMELIPSYARRKHGKEPVSYPDPRLLSLLEPTYGYMIYQEQVMETARIIAGFTLPEADDLRRAMGKKDEASMNKQRSSFVDGAVSHGMSSGTANELFSQVHKFSGYGFNKSHAAAYAVLCYHTAWLKVYHPAEFFAATMSCVMDKTDQLLIYRRDAVRHGIRILPPDVNQSKYEFVPVSAEGDNALQIRYGLGAIKGLGREAANSIAEQRETGGVFRDLFDFCQRVNKYAVNRHAIESLINAGAFDSVSTHRARLMKEFPATLNQALQSSRNSAQIDLFGMALDKTTTSHTSPQVEVEAWNLGEKLKREKEALGYPLSGHLFDIYAKRVSFFNTQSLADIAPHADEQLLMGVVVNVRAVLWNKGKNDSQQNAPASKNNKNNNQRHFLIIDDGKASAEISLDSKVFEENQEFLKEDEFIAVSCKISTRWQKNAEEQDGMEEGAPRLSITGRKIYDFATLYKRAVDSLEIFLTEQHTDRVDGLLEILSNYRSGGYCPVYLSYQDSTTRYQLSLPPKWRLDLSDECLDRINRLVGKEATRILYRGEMR